MQIKQRCMKNIKSTAAPATNTHIKAERAAQFSHIVTDAHCTVVHREHSHCTHLSKCHSVYIMANPLSLWVQI